ncbi:Protein FAR1-RELATED SEQUENCE 5 [Linum grandiflorum]
MQHEKEDNYIWVLETLTKAGGGKKPQTVITDGDRAMANGIDYVFPEATHRLCSWHLNNNVIKHVKNHKFRKGWHDFVTDEYESDAVWITKWNNFLASCGVANDPWIFANLTSKRQEWANTYFKKSFFAGMTTTSRCEGLNSKIGIYVKNGDMLLDFFLNFDRWISDLREEEFRLDFKSTQTTPEIRKTRLWCLEKSAAAAYSFEAFEKFRDELNTTSGCIKESQEFNGDSHEYMIKMFQSELPAVKVTFNVATKEVECTCYKTYRTGLPCDHMLFVLKEEGSAEVPASFVKHRWTKKPKDYEHMPSVANLDEARRTILRHGVLQYSGLEMYTLGVRSAEACKIVQEGMKDIIDKLRALDLVPTQSSAINIPEELQGIKDPKKVPFKGSAGKKGKNAIKTRRCTICREIGHYRNNCEQRNEEAHQNDEEEEMADAAE